MNPLSKLSTSACKHIVSDLTRGGLKQSQVASNFSCLAEGSILYSPQQPIAKPDIQIEMSRGPGDVHQLEDVLKRTFFYDEPSIKLFGLTGREYNGELINVMMRNITYDESLIARSISTNEIVGFALNGECENGKFTAEIDTVKDTRNKKLLALWGAIDQQFDIGNIRPSARAMEIMFLGVIPKARNKGLAKKLVSESLNMAKCRGYGVVQVVCTSDKSARICKSINMKKACDVEYDTLMMPCDGRPVVTKPPPPPNENVKIYYQTT